MKRVIRMLSLAPLLSACLMAADLVTDFRHPPALGRPGSWWWWLNGNITKEGITRDLSEMAAKGIRSVDLFDIGDPRVPVGAAPMMSPEWRQLFQHALREAARLDVEVRVTAAAGWGMGGPWIDEAHASKTLKWTEVQVDGPRELDIALPRASGAGNYYKDAAVVAFREKPSRPLPPSSIETSSVFTIGDQHEQHWPPEQAVDGDPETFWRTAKAPTAAEPQWIQLDYGAALSATGVFLSGAAGGGPKQCELLASHDGKEFHRVAACELEKGERKKISFPAVNARYFRMTFTTAHTEDVQLAELWILRDGDEAPDRPGIKWWQFKSGNRSFYDWPKAGPAVMEDAYPDTDGAVDCHSADTVDLTSALAQDGLLHWKIPAGRWTIARFGVVLLGEPPRAMSRAMEGGFEPDCFSPAAADLMYDKTAAVLVKDTPELAGKTLKGIFIDSYEIGASVRGVQPIWTDGFREQFKRRRGYDPLAYFPALTRRIVDSRGVTERFFWDYRLTLGELYNEFYGRLAQRAHRQRLLFRAESGYGTYPFPHIDGLAAFGRVDEPMGEFWYNRDELSQFFGWADPVRTAASAAHIYGKEMVAGECLTIADGRKQAPGQWKAALDREFANGMNQPMLHVWCHQPDITARPGLFVYGTVSENLTWWAQSRGFFDYLARCGHMLRRGLPVADAVYFRGEGTLKFVPAHEFIQPALPHGYEFDGVNAEVLESRLSVKDGKLTLPNGISYLYLVLPIGTNWQATPRLLRRIRALVEAGATVVGDRPALSPGLRGYPRSDREIKSISDKIWGTLPSASGSRKIGRGQVVWGRSMAEVFAKDGLKPDVDCAGMADPARLLWCHRREDDKDIFYLCNQGDQPQDGRIIFRASGRQPEIWDPLTGETRVAAAFRIAEGCTSVPMEFAASGSIFVVFRQPAAMTEATGENFPVRESLTELGGPWTVQFDPTWGGPEQPVVFETLTDWSKNPDPRIRYYSGPAIYRKIFDAPAEGATDRRIWLELGVVKNLAEVKVNGQSLGTAWTAPWRLEVKSGLRPTANQLEITVANLWVNRLVGDEFLPPDQRIAKTNARSFNDGTPLLESGLFGPVTLSSSRR
jgi:hypothetical protein